MILIVAGGDYPHSQWLGGVLGGYGTLLDVKKIFQKIFPLSLPTVKTTIY